MSLSGFILVVLAGAAAATATRPIRRLSLAVGGVGLVAALVAAVLVHPGTESFAGGSLLSVTTYLRLLLAAAAAAALLAVIVAVACGSAPRDLPAALLVTLAALAAGIALAGGSLAGSAWTPAVAGALVLGAAALLVAPTGLVDRVGHDPAGWRAASGAFHLAVIATGVAVVGMTMLQATPAGASSGGTAPVEPAAAAAALLLVAAAVAVRVGAMPFHALAARHWETGTRPGVPVLAAWLPAGLSLVAVAWAGAALPSGASQVPEGTTLVLSLVGLVTLGAGASVLLAADDLPHFVAYALVMDGGFALLALAAPGAGSGAAAREWLLLNALSKTGLAVWAVALVLAYRSERIGDLAGWIRRAPLLGLALVLVALATYGLPGWLAFSSRATLVGRSTSGPLSIVGLAVAWLGIAGYARLLLVGLRTPGSLVARGASERPAMPGLAPSVAPEGNPPGLRHATLAVWHGNVVPITAVAAVLLAMIPVLLSAGFGQLGPAAVDAATVAAPSPGLAATAAPLPSSSPSAAPAANGGASSPAGGAVSAAPAAMPSAGPIATRSPAPSATPVASPAPSVGPSTPRVTPRPTRSAAPSTRVTPLPAASASPTPTPRRTASPTPRTTASPSPTA